MRVLLWTRGSVYYSTCLDSLRVWELEWPNAIPFDAQTLHATPPPPSKHARSLTSCEGADGQQRRNAAWSMEHATCHKLLYSPAPAFLWDAGLCKYVNMCWFWMGALRYRRHSFVGKLRDYRFFRIKPAAV